MSINVINLEKIDEKLMISDGRLWNFGKSEDILLHC